MNTRKSCKFPWWKKHSLKKNITQLLILNFEKIYMKFEYLHDNSIFFKRYAITGNQKKIHKWIVKCTFFVVILPVTILIEIVYQATKKKIQIRLNTLWTFIILHNFIWQHLNMKRWPVHNDLNAYLPHQCMIIYLLIEC